MKLHEFTDWFRTDLAYKAPELYPARISWFLAEVERRFANVAEQADCVACGETVVDDNFGARGGGAVACGPCVDDAEPAGTA